LECPFLVRHGIWAFDAIALIGFSLGGNKPHTRVVTMGSVDSLIFAPNGQNAGLQDATNADYGS